MPCSSKKMIFKVNHELLAKARVILAGRRRLFWIIGGSCTGKSTISRALAGQYRLDLYDLDEYIFGRFMPRYRPDRHPASLAWFSAANPLAWALSLTWEEWDGLNRAANAEYLDLLADELVEADPNRPLLVDGGITHPSVLVQVLPAGQILCLEAPEAERAGTWESNPARAAMKEWIRALPEPEVQWAKFLAFDRLMNETIITESREQHIQISDRLEGAPVGDMAAAAAAHFDL